MLPSARFSRPTYGRKRGRGLLLWLYIRCVETHTGSSLPEEQAAMSESNITNVSLEELDEMESRTDYDRLERLTDEEIESAAKDDPDTELLDADWFQKARVVDPDVDKKRITIRLDEDIVEYFKEGGSGYQTRINDVLRAFVLAKRWDSKKTKG